MDSPRSPRPARKGLRRLAALGTATALALGGALVATAPASAAADEGTITDAVFQWGLSGEAGGGAFFGGCNFLSAGEAGNAGSGRVWSAADEGALYNSTSGNVSILKPNAAGTLVAATFANKCQTPTGTAVSAASTTSLSKNIVQITDGEGSVAADGSVEVEWDGSFTIVFYGGLTYWTASDPILTLDASGNGQVTATATGYGTSMEDQTQWVPIAAQEIVIADITGASVDNDGFVVTPDYLGVTVSTGTGTPQTTGTASSGSFPQSYIDFQFLTGQSSYWYSSGGSRDAAKPTTPLTVSYALEVAEEPVDPEPEPEPEPGEGDIIVDVPEWVDAETGTFGWAFASTSPVDLGTATQSGTNFVATGSLNDIVVTDTRAGGTGGYDWSISGQVGAFTSGGNTFSGGFLGWTPEVVSGGAGVTAGAAVTSTQLGGTGLASSAVLASSTAAASATVGAGLSLVIPGTTAAGDYTATLTVTALN